ncbi:MAG TPA: serine/threonine-protein kinase, partial [Sorangium sp.]|nr:serine/threonine-protein kinase [Sorangium sp.]
MQPSDNICAVAEVTAGPEAAPAPSGTTLGWDGPPATLLHSSRSPAIPGYELVEELGRGAMGVVYRARQLSLDRFVALKVILAGKHAGKRQLTRFRVEARALASLSHPNIVQIYDVGEAEGVPYFALELVEGETLERRLDRGAWSVREAARLVRTLAEAMAAAHQRGIVHRDLKPSNVLLARDGSPKISDFGVAKRLEGGAGETQTGDLIGTPLYMAPEQAQGRSADIGPAADVYSLGAILYELLAGRPPVVGNGLVD